jgi:hypothetical protein
MIEVTSLSATGGQALVKHARFAALGWFHRSQIVFIRLVTLVPFKYKMAAPSHMKLGTFNGIKTVRL